METDVSINKQMMHIFFISRLVFICFVLVLTFDFCNLQLLYMGLHNFYQLNRMELKQSNLTEPHMPSKDFNIVIGYIEDIVIGDSFQVRFHPYKHFISEQLLIHPFFLFRKCKLNFLTNIACNSLTKKKIRFAIWVFSMSIQK